MKVVILAGGFGTRLTEETAIKPKPMVEIGGKPILWHIMKIYSHYGFNEFIICLGYMGYYIKEYFAHYFLHQCDVTFDFSRNNELIMHNSKAEPWRVTLVDTGLQTMTGGRIKRVAPYLEGETFMLTYGDGVGNVPIDKLVEFHRFHGKQATITSVQPSGRFGMLNVDEGSNVTSFLEKPRGDGGWVNAGFFVLEPEIFDYIDGDQTVWEKGPLEGLAATSQLKTYKHCGFWKPMDTMRDKFELEALWNSGKAPWIVWRD